MARKRQIMFSVGRGNNVEKNSVRNNEARSSIEMTEEREAEDFDYEYREIKREEKSKLKKVIVKNLNNRVPEMVGVFGNNYKEEMQKAFNEVRYSMNCLILGNIDIECASGVDIYFLISAVLLDFLGHKSMDEFQRRNYLTELEMISSATEELPVYGSIYGTYEMLVAAKEKMNVSKRMKSLLNRIATDFHEKIVIPIDFGFSEINYDIIRKLNEIKTYDVVFVIGAFRNINAISTSFNYVEYARGGATFSYYFDSQNIISAD